MNISEAENMAKNFMSQHGLTAKGWKFNWNNHNRAFGMCSYNSKTIYLSLMFVRLNTESEVKDTILHEIAHAIAGYEAGHGEAWKKVCIEIDCKPVATFNDEMAFSNSTRYRAVCSKCNREYKSANKLPIYCLCELKQNKKTFLIYTDRKNE